MEEHGDEKKGEVVESGVDRSIELFPKHGKYVLIFLYFCSDKFVMKSPSDRHLFISSAFFALHQCIGMKVKNEQLYLVPFNTHVILN